MSEAYLSRGVSSTKDDVHKAIAAHDKGIYPDAFCKITEDLFGDPEYCSIMHTDDTGTKASVAYIIYKKTGDVGVWKDIAQDCLVMNLDDMLCVGAADRFIFSNTIGRNAHRVGGDAVSALIDGYSDFCVRMREYGIDMIMCGGETSDTGDIVSTVFIDSTFFARLKKSDVIDCANIRPGDVIIGFSSTGKAVYEDAYNSGIGSNGLTAARHLLMSDFYRDAFPETYSPTIDKNNVYCGKYKLEDKLRGTPLTIGKALLSPTRTYAPIIREAASSYRNSIHGIIHCTGGGLVKCKKFGKNVHYIKDSLFETPPLFKLIEENGEMTRREMFGVFNMGHRLEMFCDKDIAAAVIDISEKYSVDAKIIGRVEYSDTNKVTICDGSNEYIY